MNLIACRLKPVTYRLNNWRIRFMLRWQSWCGRWQTVVECCNRLISYHSRGQTTLWILKSVLLETYSTYQTKIWYSHSPFWGTVQSGTLGRAFGFWGGWLFSRDTWGCMCSRSFWCMTGECWEKGPGIGWMEGASSVKIAGALSFSTAIALIEVGFLLASDTMKNRCA